MTWIIDDAPRWITLASAIAAAFALRYLHRGTGGKWNRSMEAWYAASMFLLAVAVAWGSPLTDWAAALSTAMVAILSWIRFPTIVHQRQAIVEALHAAEDPYGLQEAFENLRPLFRANK